MSRRYSKLRAWVPRIENSRRQGITWAGIGRLLLAQGVRTRSKWPGDRNKAAHALASLAFRECKLARTEPQLKENTKRRMKAAREFGDLVNTMMRNGGRPVAGHNELIDRLEWELGTDLSGLRR